MKVETLIRDSEWIPGANYGCKAVEASVILPTYRRLKSGLFKKCVDSILSQINIDIELIIVDDCSVDGTFDKIQQYMEQDKRISCIHHKCNIGLPAISCYEGYCRSKADNIVYAFDDCCFSPDAYSSLLRKMNTRKADVVFWYVSITDELGATAYLGRDLIELDLKNLLVKNFVPNCGFMIKKSVHEDVGHYDPHLGLIRLCDWDLWRRIQKHYDIIPVDVYVGHEGGTVLADSLGNSYTVDYDTVYAQMDVYKKDMLSTNNYQQYDFVSPPTALSDSEKATYWGYVANEFSKKYWFDGVSKNNFDDSCNGKIALLIENYDPALDALLNTRSRYLFDFVNVVGLDVLLSAPDQIASYGCVVYYEQAKNSCLYHAALRSLRMGIPTYCFIDKPCADVSSKLSFHSTSMHNELRERLCVFSGLLVASNELAKEYTSNTIHYNISLLLDMCVHSLSFTNLHETATRITSFNNLSQAHRSPAFFDIRMRLRRSLLFTLNDNEKSLTSGFFETFRLIIMYSAHLFALVKERGSLYYMRKVFQRLSATFSKLVRI